MKIQVNGEPVEVPEQFTVADLVKLLGKQPRYLAVERNRELVPRAQHSDCIIRADDQIEIVTLVGGG